MVKLKSGENISWSEVPGRFKEGMNNITPLQKLKNEIRGTFITLLGFIFSLGAVIWKRSAIGLLAYGLILIFLGSSITTGLKWISLLQQSKFLNDLDFAQADILEKINSKEEVEITC